MHCMVEDVPCSIWFEDGDGVERVIEHKKKHACHCHHLLLDCLPLDRHLQVTQKIEKTSHNGQYKIEITDHNSEHSKFRVYGIALIYI